MNITNKRVKDAVSSLILSHPLYAGILIQQKFVADNSAENPTCAVDGESYFFNDDFVNSCDFDENKGVAAHEGGHLLGCHHTRRGNRDLATWNEATDHVLNLKLLKEGFKLPRHALVDGKKVPAQICADPRFADMSAEDVFRVLWTEKKQDPQGSKPAAGQQGSGSPQAGQPGQAPSFGQVKPAAGKSAKETEAKTRGQIEKAVSIAKIAGQLSGDAAREIKRDIAPRFDWREVLHRFFQEITARDYSFATPNRRFAHTGIILPSLRSRDIGRIVLAVDTSGSVSTAEVSAMVAEMRNCLDTYAENGLSAPLTVIYCDSRIQGIETLESGDTASPHGGGGTRFAPVFGHLAGDLDGAACLVYLTDGDCSESMADLAALAPGYPVLWGLIRDNDAFAAGVPFGECVKVDVNA